MLLCVELPKIVSNPLLPSSKISLILFLINYPFECQIAMPFHLMIIVHFWLYLDSTFCTELFLGPPQVNLFFAPLCRENRRPGTLMHICSHCLWWAWAFAYRQWGTGCRGWEWVWEMKHLIVRICWPYEHIWKWCKLFQGLLRCNVVNQTWFRQIWLIVIFRMPVRSLGTKHSVPGWEGLWLWLHWLDRDLNCLAPLSQDICHIRRLWYLKDLSFDS